MFNIKNAKYTKGAYEINDIAFNRTDYNPADALTKVRPKYYLLNVLKKSSLNISIENG